MPTRWFRIAYADRALRRFAAERGAAPEALRVRGASDLMIAFSRELRAQHTRIDEDGDGLLWEWGPDADARTFTVAMTRQLIREGDDQPIVQLRLALGYGWTPQRERAGRGHEWCFSPADLDAFTASMRGSAGYRSVASARPSTAALSLDIL